MTPTLAMLVEREADIAAFQPSAYYHVRLDCGSFPAESERTEDRAEAERIAALCGGKEARVVSVETSERREQPPRLYDLTALQRRRQPSARLHRAADAGLRAIPV